MSQSSEVGLLRALADAVTAARSKPRLSRTISAAKLLGVAEMAGAEEPTEIVQDVLAKELVALDESPAALEARLVVEVRHRSIDSARAGTRRRNALQRLGDETVVFAGSVTAEEAAAELVRLRARAARQAAAIGIAERYEANCKNQNRRVDPDVLAELRAYEIAVLRDDEHRASGLRRQTREKIARRIAQVAAFYGTIFVATLTVLFWRVRKAAAQIVQTARGSRRLTRIAFGVLLTLGAALAALVAADRCGSRESRARVDGSKVHGGTVSRATPAESSSMRQSSRASKTRLFDSLGLGRCYGLTNGYDIKACIIARGDDSRHDLALARLSDPLVSSKPC